MGSHFFYRSDGIAAKIYLSDHGDDLHGLQGEAALLNCTKGLGSDKILGLHLEAVSIPSDHHAGSEYVVVAVPAKDGSRTARRILSLDRSCITTARLRDVTILLKTP